jgi:excisionase family DNA binding protein
MTTPDYSTWLTKQQVADAIGCSTKTVEQLAKDRKIEQALWRREGRGMPLAVYDPSDVARIAAARRGEAVPFVLPAVGSGNGHGAVGIARTAHVPAEAEAQRALASGLSAFAVALQALTSHSSESSQSSQSSQHLFLTVTEAAEVLNWTPRDLRRAIRAGEVPARNTARRDWRTWRIRRRDLETL